jgi:hypothetical protein
VVYGKLTILETFNHNFMKPRALIKIVLFVFVTTALPVFSQIPGHTLVITENSSSSLTAFYDGNMVITTLVMGDTWDVQLPDLVHLGIGEGSPGAAIPEPGAGTLGPWNNVFTSTSNPFVSLVTVTSDSVTTNAFAVPLSDNVPGVAGVDGDGGAISLTFHDAGDKGSTVPDTGSTFGLLFVALIALLSASRLRSVCLA